MYIGFALDLTYTTFLYIHILYIIYSFYTCRMYVYSICATAPTYIPAQCGIAEQAALHEAGLRPGSHLHYIPPSSHVGPLFWRAFRVQERHPYNSAISVAAALRLVLYLQLLRHPLQVEMLKRCAAGNCCRKGTRTLILTLRHYGSFYILNFFEAHFS